MWAKQSHNRMCLAVKIVILKYAAKAGQNILSVDFVLLRY